MLLNLFTFVDLEVIAVKCNPDPYVLQLLAALGNGFDCASKTEIEQVLSFGVNPSRIIYAHPCKTKSYLRSAAEQGVCQMTFDNAAELYKIRDFHPKAKLLLRITTDDSASLCRLSQKFGAPPEMVVPLLTLAKQLELDIVGVAFHVGSGASDPQAFVNAVRDAHSVFEQASEIGYNLQILDVGGGFMSDTFEEMAMALSSAVEEYFPPHIRVIAEPGRFYVASAFTIAVNVIARRAIKDDAMNKTSCMLYINDGVYGNFSSIMFDHQQPVPKVLKAGGNHYFNQYQPETLKKSSESFGKMLTEYSIWGPTCDGIDCITTSWSCATLLDVGDWLFFEHMGAYTKCSATRFNGFPDSHDTIYVSSEAAVHAMLNL